MFSLFKKRFKEISDRKIHRVKMRWFDPLTDAEMEKLGLTHKEKKLGI